MQNPELTKYYSNSAHLEGDLHDLSCGYDRSGLPYTVSLRTEVSKVEGCEGGSTGPSLFFSTAYRASLLKSCNEVATARTSWTLT